MLRAISTLFDIRPQEWPRVLMLYFFGGLFLVGMTWGETIAEALFLKQVGVQFLAYTFIADAILGILAIAIYTAFVDRIPNDRLAVGLFAVFAVLIWVGRALIESATLEANFAYLYIFLLSHLVRDLFVLHWWTFVIGLYDTRTAKRVAPFLSTAARPAGVIAGFSMPILNAILPPENIILVWSVVVLMVAGGVILMPRILKDWPAPGASTGQRTSYVQNIREGARFVTGSKFLQWMAISSLIMTVLFAVTNYQTSRILVAELGSVKAVSEFTGALTGITNLVMLPIQLFFLSRIVSWLGLANANLIFPVGTFGISGALALLPGSVITAGASYFNRTTFRTGFRITLDNLLYNAVPLRIKGRSRAFIGGFIVPIGSLIGGGLLFLIPALPADVVAWVLPAFILLLAVSYTASVFVIRSQYREALISMLEQEDFSFLINQAGEVSVSDLSTLSWLTNKLKEADTPEMTVFMAKLIADVGGKQTAPMLIQTAQNGDPAVRAAILDSLIAADVRSDEVRQFFSDSIKDADGRVRQSAIAGLKQGANTNSEQFLALALELSRDPSLEVRAEVLPPLVRSGDLYYVAGAIQALTIFLRDPNPHWRSRAVEILGQADDPRFIRNLMEYLPDPDDSVRLQASTAIERLSERGIPKPLMNGLQLEMSKLLTDPVERIRQAALIVLGRLNNAETQQTLLTFLTDPSQEIRDSAVIALSRMGKSAVLLLQPSLESDNALMRRMATVALCKIDRERSVDLIRSYILNNLTAIYGNHVRLNALIDCSGYRSMGILVSTLRERNADMIAEIFYLLSALHDPKTIRVIADSLDTDDSRKRANALEAIEERSTPQIARLIAPLFDRELPTDQLIKIARENSGIGGNSKEIMTAIATDANDSWLRAVMLVALAEISASVFEIAMSKAESLESSEEERKPQSSDIRDSETREGGGKIRGKTGRSSLDLLGTLTGDSKLARSEPPPDQPTRKGSRPKTGDISTVPDSKAIASVPSTSALSPCQSLFSKFEVDALLKRAENNPQEVVRLAVVSATRMVAGQSVTEIFQSQGGIMLSAIEKIIFLKEVSFFEGMTIDQLKILASVAEEEVFNEDQVIFNEGELGGALYVVVRGRVALERDSGGARKGSMLRIGTVQAYSYFGEMTLFDNSPRSERAIATQDTLVLRLRREPLIALTRQYPELSLKLINVLSARLREANDRIAQLTTAKPRELHKVFDKLG